MLSSFSTVFSVGKIVNGLHLYVLGGYRKSRAVNQLFLWWEVLVLPELRDTNSPLAGSEEVRASLSEVCRSCRSARLQSQ